MEAVPRLPMINFDLKVSTEVATFAAKLKQYIASFYHEDPESYNTEIHNLETLRAGAVRPAIDVMGCQLLKKYYCQLHFLKSRFPMEEGQASAIYFSWRDSYSNMSCSVPDIDFELMCVLYNIGALHSKLGSVDTRVSPEGMKMACTHFQCAAWAFQTVRETYPQMVSLVLAPEVVYYMHMVCLAQAQECILEKSMMDNRKATIIAKVAVQVVDYYKQALATLQTGVDEGSFSDLVGSRTYKDWIKYLTFKVSYHKAIALLYQGQQAEEQQKMGERVAFYQAACDQLQDARKRSTNLSQQQEIGEALAFTGDVVEGKRKAAKNENEFIYHEDVPEKDALQEVKGASLVKGIPFNINDVEVSGQDIFARLVPMEAHEASSMYSEQKAQMLRQLGDLVDNKDRALGEFMSSLQLDVLSQMRQANGLTQDLVDRAAAMSARPTATQDLVNAMAKLSNTYHDVEAMLNEIDVFIKDEERKEQEYQAQMGNRPPSIVATELAREAAKYREAHSKASESNQNLHRAMTTHIANLKVLAMPLAHLQQHIPSVELPSREVNEEIIREIESLVAKVDEMKGQRTMLWTQLRDSVMADDITSLLVTRQPEQSLDQLFSQELQKHKKQAALLEQNTLAQENILKAFVDTYARFTNTRRYLQDIISRRSTTISALINSYDTYDDLLAKANKGLEFYNKLETNVTKLLQRIKSTCNVQDEERDQMLSKNVKKKPEPKVVTSSGPKLKDYLDSMKSAKVTDVASYVPLAGNAQSIPDQSWPPAIRPAPLGSEMNNDTPVCPSYSTNEKYSSYATQSQYNPQSIQSASSSYPVASDYGYANTYSDKMVDQGLTDRIAALMVNANTQPTYESQAQPQVYSQYDYGYNYQTGNVGSDLATPPPQPAYPHSSVNYASTNSALQPTHSVPQIAPTPSGQVNYAAAATSTTAYTGHPSQYIMTTTYSVPPGTYIAPTIASPTTFTPPAIAEPPAASIDYSANYSIYKPNLGYEAVGFQHANTYIQAPTSYAITNSYEFNTAQALSDYQSSNYPYTSPQPQTFTDPSMYANNTQYSNSKTQPNDQSNQMNPAVNQPTYQNTGYSDYYGGSNLPQMSLQSSMPHDSSYYGTAGVPQASPASNTSDSNYYSSSHAAVNALPGNMANSTDLEMQNYHSQYSYGTPSSGLYTNTMSYSTQQTPTSTYSTDPNYYNYYGTYPAAGTETYNSNYTTSEIGTQNISGATSQHSLTTIPNTTATVNETIPLVNQMKKDSSNIDLLSGLDFTVTQVPLVPQKNTTQVPAEVSTTKATEPQPTVSPKTVKSEEKIGPPRNVMSDEIKIREKVPKGDPFENPETVKQFLQELEKYEKFVDVLTKKTLNGPTPLDLKWKEIQDKQDAEAQKKSISVARCYPMKNRFPDILPYDFTRIRLLSTKDDYINASYIRDLAPDVVPFIVTQAPLPTTYGDFWTMVWEQQVEVIVCLLNDNELREEIYWPKELNKQITAGNFMVLLQNVVPKDHWTAHTILITQLEKRETKMITHFQFNSWPGSLFPTSPVPILKFTKEILSHYDQLQRTKLYPILVHCTSGVGRSGLFCLVAAAILATDSAVLPDLSLIAAKLSVARKNIVRDREHLKFAYEVYLHYLGELRTNRFTEKAAAKVEDSSTFVKQDSTNLGLDKTSEDPLNSLDPLWATKKGY